MGILTLAVIAAGILIVAFVIRRVASSNSATGSRSPFNIENADPAPLNFNLNILEMAKENKKHQDQTRKNFEESRKRNENMHKQIEGTNKRYRTMWG
jgi:cell shape-determining protein MreC